VKFTPIYQTLVKWSCILGFFGLSACSTQQVSRSPHEGKAPNLALAERVRNSPKLAVLFIGNSYSFGVPKAFSSLAAERGKEVRVGHSTYGGWSLERHACHESTLEKIRRGKWDIVVIQEQSEIPAFPQRKRDAKMFPPLRRLVEEVRSQGAVPVLYQTWGRRDGDPKRRTDDFHAMNQRLREGYQAAAKDAGNLVVVPVGDAWERAISQGNGAELFMPDGSHPTSKGNTLTAETFYQSIYGH
jgi:hypothetical protein